MRLTAWLEELARDRRMASETDNLELNPSDGLWTGTRMQANIMGATNGKQKSSFFCYKTFFELGTRAGSKSMTFPGLNVFGRDMRSLVWKFSRARVACVNAHAAEPTGLSCLTVEAL